MKRRICPLSCEAGEGRGGGAGRFHDFRELQAPPPCPPPLRGRGGPLRYAGSWFSLRRLQVCGISVKRRICSLSCEAGEG